jgi:tRNA (guanine-N7-)-methyltransferase
MSTLSKFYGRRKGRSLRPLQQQLWEGLSQFELTAESPIEIDTEKPLHLEIGFGAGEHLAGQAERNPDINYIGCEAFLNGIVALLQHIQSKALQNIRIYADDARPLLARLPEESIDRIYILFPDPWPKKRHHKRRLVSQPILEALARLTKPGSELRIATDDDSYAQWIEETLANQTYFEGPINNIDEEPADWVPTRYQARAQRLGNTCRFYRMIRK